MFQPDLERMDHAAKKQLQSERLVEMLRRLKASTSPYWREKMAAVGEIRFVDDVRGAAGHGEVGAA